ncbi:SdiA-regulated domain-containing protein [Cyclobacterium sp. 1_MG-2023]|uniref:SdiA-regulated domain-containing protein n=1 Tax=Cyclobacterium sp. 1_MG-2023 TaxID=3062681 RepID=UPI0026E1AED7|nr:SdiA-regulated domain-containing protein [Cyclobacterium sp. 1_MG-2023]MDO6439984.1 SdiA-regulated domain-containing protein [Cyclobacterium sp. 1_MG-2023]
MIQFSQILTFIILANWQCASISERVKGDAFPSAYDLNDFTEIVLQDRMEEVSGLEWVGDKLLLAIEDESSIIYSLSPETGEIIDRQKFAKNADIEDIAWSNDRAWVLQSNGTLYEVTSPFTEEAESEKYTFPIKKKRDFEALVVSEDGAYVYTFCKTCEWDKKTKEASIYRFDLGAKAYEEVALKTLKASEIRTILKFKEKTSLKMEPAAVALHPIENKYYILSSTGKWLLITDTAFNSKEIYELNAKIFKQPEGITFDPKGNMYVSNEARGGKPNLLIFKYKP